MRRLASPSPSRPGDLLLCLPLPHTPSSEAKFDHPPPTHFQPEIFVEHLSKWFSKEGVVQGSLGGPPISNCVSMRLDFLHMLQAKAIDCNRLNVEVDVRIQALLLSQIFQKIWNKCQTVSLFSPKVF